MKYLKTLLLFSLLIFILSCDDDPAPLQFQFEGLDIVESTQQGLYLDLLVRVRNPNDYDYVFNEIKYNIQIANKIVLDNQLKDLLIRKDSNELKKLRLFIEYPSVKVFFDHLLSNAQTEFHFSFAGTGNYGKQAFANKKYQFKKSLSKEEFFNLVRDKS